MNDNDLSQWLLVILRKEEYDFEDYEVHGTPATLEQAQAMFEGLACEVRGMRYEKLTTRIIHAEAWRTITRPNVEDPHGEIEILRFTYGWRPPQETTEYAEWVKGGVDVFEEPFRKSHYLTDEMAKHLSAESAPPSVKVSKTLTYEGVFVCIADVATLLHILKRMGGELDPTYWDYHHEGHGERSNNPIPVTALILENDE